MKFPLLHHLRAEKLKKERDEAKTVILGKLSMAQRRDMWFIASDVRLDLNVQMCNTPLWWYFEVFAFYELLAEMEKDNILERSRGKGANGEFPKVIRPKRKSYAQVRSTATNRA